MSKIPVLLMVLLVILVSAEDLEQLRSELVHQKTEYLRKQELLKEKTTKRWREREEYLREMERYREEKTRLQSEIEELYNSVSLAREENFMLNRNVKDIQSEHERHLALYRYSRESVEKQLYRLEQAQTGWFPLNQQGRMKALQEQVGVSVDSLETEDVLGILTRHLRDYIHEGTVIHTGRHSLLTDREELVDGEVIRLGNLLAYCVESGDSLRAFLVSSGTGDRAVWREIIAQEMVEQVTEPLLSLQETGEYRGAVPVDLTEKAMQAAFSKEEVGLKAFLKGLFRKGGVTMYPLGVVLFWALGIVMLKLAYLLLYRIRTVRSAGHCSRLAAQGKWDEMNRFLQKRHDRIASIAKICLRSRSVSRETVEESVREEMLREIPHLERGMGTLAVLASSAPLLGLFGTVTGMIRMFETITLYGTGDPKLLAGGISEALVTTEVGLAIAIPLMLIHSFLRNRKNSILNDMELFVLLMLNRQGGDHHE